MGDVIDWLERRRRREPRPRPDASETGNLLLFTGVRYERQAAAPAPSSEPDDGVGGTRRRKRRG
jgi:hypothetical protein